MWQKQRCCIICAVIFLQLPTSFSIYNKIIGLLVVEKIESSIMQASRKAVAENKKENPSHVTAWFDVIWQKCGHTSLNDIISAT